MSDLPAPPRLMTDLDMLKVARHLAMDLHPLETILKAHEIDENQWEAMRNNARFQRLLASEIEAWNSAENTPERIRLKSLCFVEEALPEFYARAHDNKETLSAKIEVLKTVARFAGIGVSSTDTTVMGERFSVTINLGQDQQFKIEKAATSAVIEGETV